MDQFNVKVTPKFHHERSRRLRIVTYALPAILGMFLFVFDTVAPSFISGESVLGSQFLSIAVLSLFMASIAGYLMHYLQTGFRHDPESSSSIPSAFDDSEPREFRRLISERHRALDSQVEVLADRISALADQGDQLRSSGPLSDEEMETLIDSTAAKVQSEAAEKVLSHMRKQIADTDRENEFVSGLADSFISTINRLERETYALSRRGNLNLVLGILTTVIGLGFLVYFVFTISGGEGPYTSLLIDFAPRLSLVLFIQVFAYFFLRLYKASLSEIKYFQNELTNVESKGIALWTSARLGDSSATRAVIEKLAATERNNVLEKGQTTVELEQAKMKEETPAALVKELLRAIRREDDV